MCLAQSAVALSLPETTRAATAMTTAMAMAMATAMRDGHGAGHYLRTLRAGLAEVRANRGSAG